MRIRHIVAEDRVDGLALIRDPASIRHCIIHGGQIAELSGPIDPLTHLNLDFPEHQACECIVAERLQVGAKVLLEEDTFRTARVGLSSLGHFGQVSVAQRRREWLRVTTRVLAP